MRRRWIGRPKRDEFAPVSAELLIALASTSMPDRARRVLLALVATSYGRYRDDVPLRRSELEALTGLDRSSVRKAIVELEQRGAITVEPASSRGKRETFRISKRYREWTPPVELNREAEPTYRSVPSGRDVAAGPQPTDTPPARGPRATTEVAREPRDVAPGPPRSGPRATPASRVNGEKNSKNEETVNVGAEPPRVRPSAPAHEPPPTADTVDDRDLSRRKRRPISPEVEHAVERLLETFVPEHRSTSRGPFFDLAHRGLSEHDLHDTRELVSTLEDIRSRPRWSYTRLANLLAARGQQPGKDAVTTGARP